LNLYFNHKTPIQNLNENLNNNTFFMKREDLLPVSFGGNKARKATLFFEDLEEKGADCVITYGSSSSNHCRVIANIAASKKLQCYIISPVENNQVTSNSRIIKLLGAQVILCPVSKVSKTIEDVLRDLKKRGHIPYFIQGGGHGDLGTHSYVKVYDEILEYEKENNIFFDYVFHASGTGTTQAGLICGKILNNDYRKIVGISNARKNPYGKNVIVDSVNSYLTSIRAFREINSHVNFSDQYILDGYGSYNNEILKVVKNVLINDGIPLDTTYTGKSFWGMKEYIKENKIKNKRILFIHTGGTPLFFDNLEDLNNE